MTCPEFEYPNMDMHGDPHKAQLDEQKDDLLNSEVFDADELQESEETPDPEEAERERKVADAQRARDAGLSTREVADIVDMSQPWVIKYTDDTADSAADD
jgi:hypothetical protein